MAAAARTREHAEEPATVKPLAITIPAPRMKVAAFTIQGTTPYCQNRFSGRTIEAMRQAQELGSQAKKGRKREPKDFKAAYENAIHRSEDGWYGIPAPAFRTAMISACRIVGFKMTVAKLSVFTLGDGFDAQDQTPLVRITKGEPAYKEHGMRNANGNMDVRARPVWAPGWQAQVRVQWDEDQFSLSDVTNLMARVGLQVGVGEGRPDSRMSAGVGWGLFDIVGPIQ